jgi:hypothetical protein
MKWAERLQSNMRTDANIAGVNRQATPALFSAFFLLSSFFCLRQDRQSALIHNRHVECQ